jgi:hypothetical protein
METKTMRKVIALVAMSGSFVLALGLNCIPNVPNLFSGITGQLNALIGN